LKDNNQQLPDIFVAV